MPVNVGGCSGCGSLDQHSDSNQRGLLSVGYSSAYLDYITGRLSVDRVGWGNKRSECQNEGVHGSPDAV